MAVAVGAVCAAGSASASSRSSHGASVHIDVLRHLSARSTIVTSAKFFNGYENELACASSSDCTAVTASTRYSFNPTGAGKVRRVHTDLSGGYDDQLGIACASSSKCVEVDADGKVQVFDPRTTQKATQFTMTGQDGQTAVDCPTGSRCVVETYQGETAFDPGHVGAPTTAAFTANGNGADPIISCPSSSYCAGSDGTGNNNVGQLYTYNPDHPAAAVVHSFRTTPQLGPVSCISTSFCAALGSPKRNPALNVGVMTFDPQHPGNPKVTVIADSSLDVLTCQSRTLCAAVGNQQGVLIFNPLKPNSGKHLVAAPYGNDFVGLAFLGSSKLVLLSLSGGKAVINPRNPPKSVKVTPFNKATKVAKG